MTRLDKALERIKRDEPAQIGAATPGPNTNRLFSIVGQVEDPIAGELARTKVDLRAMYGSHVITSGIESSVNFEEFTCVKALLSTESR